MAIQNAVDIDRSPSHGSPSHSTRSRASTARAIISAAVLGVVALAAVALLPPLQTGGVLLGLSALYLTRRLVFSFTSAMFIIAGVVMFIPIRRYAIPSGLPFALEPYRVVLVAVILAVTIALLIDPAFRWRRMRFGVPLAVYLGTLLLSIVVNIVSITQQGLVSSSLGGVVNFLTIISVLFLTRQLLATEKMVMGLLTFLAWAGGIVGFFAVVEKITHVNVFLMLDKFTPLIRLGDDAVALRSGGARAFASAQHPIALSVMMCMLVPIAIYLSKHGRWPRNMYNRRIVFTILTLLMFGGISAAISRTAVVVLGVMFLITLILRPYLAVTIGLLGLPALFIGSLISPKIVASTLGSFFDVNSLIASQYTSAGWGGAGRLADLSPAFSQVAQSPIFGTGFGTRIVVGDNANAFILDNHVLGTLLEAGAVGVVGLAVFILYPPIRLLVYAFRAKADDKYTQLAFAIAISAVGYATALFFYDAFGFMQTLLVLSMLLAVGIWVLEDAPRRQQSSTVTENRDAAALASRSAP